MLRFTEFRIAVPSVLACCGLVATGPASAQTLPERTLSSDAARSVLANAPAALKTISAADLESFAKTLAWQTLHQHPDRYELCLKRKNHVITIH